jgi:hypothetical protein
MAAWPDTERAELETVKCLPNFARAGAGVSASAKTDAKAAAYAAEIVRGCMMFPPALHHAAPDPSKSLPSCF